MPIFNEEKLLSEICRVWGEYGAHAEVMRDLLSRASRVGAQGGERWPETPADIRDFIGSSFTAAKFRNYDESHIGFSQAEPHEDDLYTVSAHDLLEAFSFWRDSAPVPSAGSPMTEEQVIELHKQHMTAHVGWMAFARAIEAAHGITSVGSVSTEGEVRNG